MRLSCRLKRQRNVEDDIEERKLKADARQKESEAEQMKHATFTPKINRAEAGHDYHANCDVFQRLSSHTGSPLIIKSKSKPAGRMEKDRVYSKKLRRPRSSQQSAALFASPRRIKQMSDRLYRNHEKIELKKQVHKKSIERQEEERRARSKVLAHSRKIIVKAFLSKFKQVILRDSSRDLDNMTCFSYDEIEMALKQIGYGTGTSKIQQLIGLLDPDHTNSVRWGDMKRFFSSIAANKTDSKRNRELYQIMQFLYVNKLLKAKPEHGAPQKPATAAKWDAKKWEGEVEKRRRKQLLNQERREREQRDRRSKEMAECTFVPKINRNATSTGKRSLPTTKSSTDEQGQLRAHAHAQESEEREDLQLVDVPRFEQLYEDAQDRKMRQNEKIIERELENYKQYKAYTFRPRINRNGLLSQAEVAAEHEPQGFDQAILRLSEGRIRSKQKQIRQQYEQKKMSLQWQKRAKWLKQHKAEPDADQVADALLQQVELANV